jgi:uncharacterized protein YbaP (TraB family)
MLLFALRVSIPVLLTLFSLPTFAQSKWPNTLLWRITGKGLEKPSYLYGTMHLQDKRLFQFGDSLYNAMEKTDGFAMEIDANEYMDSVIANSIKEAEKELLLKKQKVKLNRRKLSKSADSLLQSFGIKGDVATKKDLKKIRDRRLSDLMHQGEMPTIVDAYLLGMAKRMKKWTGGIEDVNDQLNLSDELGGSLEPEAVLLPEDVFKGSIEQMIKVYLLQDLDKIDEISNRSYSGEDKDLMLTNRNVKMAFRMDSLSHQRSMFFAVGAAHLPGDSGVISLLRGNGYTVEPVYSSAKISADAYSAKLQEVEWVKVEGNENAYTVSMPGKPSDYNMFGNLVKMKMYFDMTTMTFYLSGSVSGAQVDAARMDEMMKEAIQNITGKKVAVKPKTIQKEDLLGKEAMADNAEGSYRMQMYVKDKTVFMLMVGAMKKGSLHSPDADRFLASFVPGNTTLPKKEWQTFSLKDKAFSVQMPGKPSPNEAMDSQMAEGSNWRTYSYNTVDAEKGFYYLVQVRELKEGYFLNGDSAFFEQVKEDYKAKVDELLNTKISTYQGYPVLYMDGYLKEANAIYKTMHVSRGNRDYMLIGGATMGSDMSDVDVFLKSFKILPVETINYSQHGSEGFFTAAPATFKKAEGDSTESSRFYSAHYTSYNSNEAVSYDVFVNTFSPTYWVANDSTYFNSKIAQYLGEGDSLLKKEWVQNGNVKGIGFVVQMPGYNSFKKVRLLVNGDTLYTLFSVILKQDIDKAYHQEFFNNFRFVREVPPTIYTSKTAQLLNALQTGDSLTFEDASENLELIAFRKGDLPLLHRALLKQYKDSNEYNAVTGKLVNIISDLADSTTLGFVEKEYASLKGSRESLQYHLLTLLAKMKTATSYALLKQLLLTQLPATGEPWQLQRALFDSTLLTATLYPAILEKGNDSLFGRVAVILANHLLDSNLLASGMLRPYHNQLLQGAKKSAAIIKADKERAWEFVEWSHLLGTMNSTESNALLKQMLPYKDIYVKQHIILSLLRNNLAVSAADISQVGADKVQRGDFYAELKKLKKENLFPAVYASQKSLAESELYNFFSEEYDEFTLTYIGEKIEEYNGSKKRFHLFKVRLAYEDEKTKQNFLAVAGPYDLAAKEKLTYADASGFYTDEEFHPAKVNKELKAYLKQIQPAGQ